MSIYFVVDKQHGKCLQSPCFRADETRRLRGFEHCSVQMTTTESPSDSRPLDRKRIIVRRNLCSVLFFLGLSILLLLSAACRKKVAVPVSPPIQSAAKLPSETAPSAITPSVVPPSKPASVEPAPAPKVSIAPSSFDLGITSFKAGDYGKASQLFEDYLRAGPNSENRDIALFHIFLSRILSGNSNRNTRRAEDALKRLVSEFPNSPYKEPAEYILGLQAQIESLKLDIKEKEVRIKQLSEELQKLKEIDLQRRPSRPLY